MSPMRIPLETPPTVSNPDDKNFWQRNKKFIAHKQLWDFASRTTDYIIVLIIGNVKSQIPRIRRTFSYY